MKVRRVMTVYSKMRRGNTDNGRAREKELYQRAMKRDAVDLESGNMSRVERKKS